MSGLFSKPKQATVVQEVTPEIVDDSKKTRELERNRKKKRGISAALFADDRNGQGLNVGKKTLG